MAMAFPPQLDHRLQRGLLAAASDEMRPLRTLADALPHLRSCSSSSAPASSPASGLVTPQPPSLLPFHSVPVMQNSSPFSS